MEQVKWSEPVTHGSSTFEVMTVELHARPVAVFNKLSDARLGSLAPELIAALHEARRAIGDHFAPEHCYATGPLTGDSFRDLIQCPACSAIAMYDSVIAKATGA